MRLNLLVSTEGFYEERKIAELLSDLQLFFTVTAFEHRIDLPTDFSHALPLTHQQVKTLVDARFPRSTRFPDDLTVLMTSRLGHSVPTMELIWDRRLPILSNYRQRHKRLDANSVWAVRHLLHLGMSLFLDTPCPDSTCVCNNLGNFLTLCDRCEDLLRTDGYRDGIAQLKDGINWLNQRVHSAKPNMALRPLISPDNILIFAVS